MEKNLSIQEEYNCQGYFGFGNGIAMSKNVSVIAPNINPEGGMKLRGGCDDCLIKNQCWEAHKNLVRKKMPEVTKAVDDLASKGVQGPALLNRLKLMGVPGEPYSAVMLANMEDASFIIGTGKPKDRGEKHTLKYPFETESDQEEKE